MTLADAPDNSSDQIASRPDRLAVSEVDAMSSPAETPTSDAAPPPMSRREMEVEICYCLDRLSRYRSDGSFKQAELNERVSYLRNQLKGSAPGETPAPTSRRKMLREARGKRTREPRANTDMNPEPDADPTPARTVPSDFVPAFTIRAVEKPPTINQRRADRLAALLEEHT